MNPQRIFLRSRASKVINFAIRFSPKPDYRVKGAKQFTWWCSLARTSWTRRTGWGHSSAAAIGSRNQSKPFCTHIIGGDFNCVPTKELEVSPNHWWQAFGSHIATSSGGKPLDNWLVNRSWSAWRVSLSLWLISRLFTVTEMSIKYWNAFQFILYYISSNTCLIRKY